MANPYQAVESTSVVNTDAPSRAWIAYWLLSYLTPFAFLVFLIWFFGDRPVDGRILLVLFIGPFVCGIAGSAWAFHSAKLRAIQLTLFLSGTIVAYGVGVVLFWFVCILLFGVVAT